MADKVAAEVERRLAAARVPESRNKITASDLRKWAVEYLQRNDEEAARLPELAGLAHWNLWMMDTELDDALFAVLVFKPAGVELICGTGNSFAIRRWDSDDPTSSTDGLLAELRRDFRVPEDSLLLPPGRRRSVARAQLVGSCGRPE